MSESIDFQSKDFQEWLESRLMQIMSFNPRSLMLSAVSADNGSVALCYFDADYIDLRLVAHTMLDEATMMVIQENQHTESEESDEI